MMRAPDFDEEMDRLQDHMPDWAGRNFDRLRQPEAVWVRVPAGIALIGGGVLSFLPVLGIWMLPVGAGAAGLRCPADAARHWPARCVLPTARSRKRKERKTDEKAD